MTGRGAQFLTFYLGGEEYGLDILRVQEIKGQSPITPIPNVPGHIRGVMNLRGAVVPLVDLRARFGMPAAELTRFAVFVIVNVGKRVVGLIVDAVSDVIDVPAEALQPTPDLGGVEASFLSGMARAGDRLIQILDIESTAGERT